MNYRALGFIETKGYIASIEAADAGLKSANVKLIGLEKVTGGLVMIKLEGDVSAVKTAVDAGASAASLIGTVIATTVIARPGEGLDTIIKGKNGKKKQELKEVDPKKDKEDEVEKDDDQVKELFHLEPIEVDFEERTIDINNRDELESLKVVELRRLGRILENIDIGNKDIKYGKKDELIEAILSFAKQREVSTN